MSNRSEKIVVCERCRNLKHSEARGLCKCCYNRIREGRKQVLSLNQLTELQQRVTPGEWDTYDDVIPGVCQARVYDPEYICTLFDNLADGELIARAPELLAEVIRLHEAIQELGRERDIIHDAEYSTPHGEQTRTARIQTLNTAIEIMKGNPR